MKVDMGSVWKARRLASKGVSIKDIAEELGMSEASVREYTKGERKKLKEDKKRKLELIEAIG